MRLNLIVGVVLGCAIALLPSLASAGDHWIDNAPPAGVDVLGPSAGTIELDLDLDTIPDATVALTGMTVMNRSDSLDDSMQFPGLRPIDGHLDVLDLEIAQLILTGGGMTLLAGNGLGQGGVLGPSLGAVAEQPVDPSLGDSFFDVYLELDLGGGNYVYNHTPIRISSVLDGVPVYATYDSGPVSVALFDVHVAGQGRQIATLTRFELTTVVPEPAVLTLAALGGLALLARRRK